MKLVLVKVCMRAGKFCLGAIVSFCLLAGCVMDSETSARKRAAHLAHAGDLVHFQSGQTCTAAVFRMTDSEGAATFNVPVTDAMETALAKADNKQAIAFDNSDISPNDFTRHASTNRAPAAMRIVAAGTAALKCMPEDVKNAYFGALTSPDSVTIIDMRHSALVIVDRVSGLLYLVRGGF